MTTPDLIPNLNAARHFIKTLAPDENIVLQTFDDDKVRSTKNRAELNYDPFAKVFHGPLDQHLSSLGALQQQGAGVFMMINAGDGLGRSNKNVTRIRAHALDLDGAPIEPVLAAGLPPHILVESSPGKWHAYWLNEDCPLDKFKERQHALADRFGGDRSVCDLARVLRLPGFWHLKGEPFQTRLVKPTL
jgi:hypothetical protein